MKARLSASYKIKNNNEPASHSMKTELLQKGYFYTGYLKSKQTPAVFFLLTLIKAGGLINAVDLFLLKISLPHPPGFDSSLSICFATEALMHIPPEWLWLFSNAQTSDTKWLCPYARIMWCSCSGWSKKPFSHAMSCVTSQKIPSSPGSVTGYISSPLSGMYNHQTNNPRSNS